ncbi:MAG TPA: ABC transporter ATP-binding protein [Steroidobacteraceae bacterium]|nr:ABC transporter ATP-binding protein [Steroidobacteraceae bacterium]
MRKVVKSYKTRGQPAVSVLRGLDLDISQGDFVALMGPSGSGKTTILNLMGGIDRPDAGEVMVAGHHLEGLSSDELGTWRSSNVGFVFQSYHLMPMLSAAANVELPLLLTTLSRAERRAHVETVLKVVGLLDRATHKPSQLSGGQQQRVGIARALVADPILLLCDEPTGDLDRTTADEILSLLKTLNQNAGKTIVMVTHDQKAADFGTRQFHFDKGELLEPSTEDGR